MAKKAENRAFPDLDLGHERVWSFLESIQRGRIPALLFTGPDGSGKEYTAIRFANDLVCSADGISDARVKADNLEHPDVHLIYPTPTQCTGESEDGDVTDLSKILDEKRTDIFARYQFAKKASLRIARSRAMIARANTKPFGSPYTVFVVNDAHTMREEAQNALLKLVEEPPPHGVVIFVTSNPEAILYTIRSRCQSVRFNPIPTKALEGVLCNYYGVDAKTATRTARLAQGSVQRARRLIDSFDDTERDAAANVVQHLGSEDAAWAIGAAVTVGKTGNRDAVGRFLHQLSVLYRDVMVDDPDQYINVELERMLRMVSDDYPTKTLPWIIDRISKARFDITVRNMNVDASLTQLFLDIRRESHQGR